MIGATERPGSIGRRVLWALLSSPFGGTVYPVSKDRPSVLGIKAYPNVAAVPEAVDMAVIATPAATVPGIIGECVQAGVKTAVIISAGFKEHGEAGPGTGAPDRRAHPRHAPARRRSQLPWRHEPAYRV